jgi:hypothetical protein
MFHHLHLMWTLMVLHSMRLRLYLLIGWLEGQTKAVRGNSTLSGKATLTNITHGSHVAALLVLMHCSNHIGNQ